MASTNGAGRPLGNGQANKTAISNAATPNATIHANNTALNSTTTSSSSNTTNTTNINTPTPTNSTTRTEAHLREQVDTQAAELAHLHRKIEKLEAQNDMLKKSIYELSFYHHHHHHHRHDDTSPQMDTQPGHGLMLPLGGGGGGGGGGGVGAGSLGGGADKQATLKKYLYAPDVPLAAHAKKHDPAIHAAFFSPTTAPSGATGAALGVTGVGTGETPGGKGVARTAVGTTSPGHASTAATHATRTKGLPSDAANPVAPSSPAPTYACSVLLEGHEAAICTLRCQVRHGTGSDGARWIASGGMDATVRFWTFPVDHTPASARRTLSPTATWRHHRGSVTCLEWQGGGTTTPSATPLLLTGSLDRTCSVLDPAQAPDATFSASSITSYRVAGLVNCVRWHPRHPHLFFCGMSRHGVCLVDRRAPREALAMDTSAMPAQGDGLGRRAGGVSPGLRDASLTINSLHVFEDKGVLLTADAAGYLKYWDLRTGSLLHGYAVARTATALDRASPPPTDRTPSTTTTSSSLPLSHLAVDVSDRPDAYRLAVSTFDGTVRMYDATLPAAATAPLPDDAWCRYRRVLEGRSRPPSHYYPSRCVFFRPTGWQGRRHPCPSYFVQGRSEADVLVWDATALDHMRCVARLQGHHDRVNDVDAMAVAPGASASTPRWPMLVSGSADRTVRVWTPAQP